MRVTLIAKDGNRCLPHKENVNERIKAEEHEEEVVVEKESFCPLTFVVEQKE